MPPGKAASQAGHAFLESFTQAPDDLKRAYLGDGLGTKIVLVAPDEAALRLAYAAAIARGLPAALVIDSGHQMPPHFDGSDIVTALGLGPARRTSSRPIIAGFPLF